MIFVTAIFEGADSSAPFSFQENSTKSKSGGKSPHFQSRFCVLGIDGVSFDCRLHPEVQRLVGERQIEITFGFQLV
jgi:hypothetical protein